MRTVRIEKSSAIGAQHLDGFLRSDWALRNGLIGDGIHHRLAILADHRLSVRAGLLYLLRLDQFRRVVRFQVLHDPLRNQRQSVNNAHWQQQPQRRPRHVHPKVANRFFFPPSNAAHERNGQRNAHGCRNKIVICEPRHLGEIAHRGFARVILPICIRGERGGGVEGQVLRNRAKLLRIQRQPLLHALDQVQH